MDLNLIKQRLDSMQGKGSKNGKKNYFKPSVGKEVIRVVPFKYNSKFPFTEIRFYYGIGDKKVMPSPASWGEKDPIMEFAKKLRDTNDQANIDLAKKLYPKNRVFAPVIIRGKEEEGVKLWQFGKKVYQQFLNLADDSEVGDYTDILKGRDIKLTTVGPEATGTKYNETTLTPSFTTSPLVEDEELLEKILENQPNPKEVYTPYSYDEMKEELEKWLSSDDDEEEEIISEEAEAFDDEPKTNYSAQSAGLEKKSKAEKFDEMFRDDEEQNDDLPF